MTEFYFEAVDRNGQSATGQISANGREEALRHLRARGLTPLMLEAAEQSAQKAKFDGRLGLLTRISNRPATHADVLAVTSELSIMLRAGIPLDRALRILLGMMNKSAMYVLVEDLLKSIKSGKGLSQALTPHQALFGHFYINMVRSGEAGGQLGEVLGQLAEHLEWVRGLRESILSALLYPSILVVVACVSVFLMLGFVVPQFESLFEDLGDALPLPTRIIVSAGNLVVDYGWLLMLGAGFIVWALRAWSNTPHGRAWRDRKLLALPGFGEVLRKYEITRLTRSMGALLRSGVPIVTAIRIAAETIGNSRLREAMEEVIPSIKRGRRLAEALEMSNLLTPLALNMVRLGEETGRLDEMLLEVAKVHDREVQAGIKRVLQLVEPVLILLLGGVIALIIISILMGILSVNDLANV